MLRLARTMGIPASELEHRMSEAELVDHMLDDQIEPWGPVRGDIQAALIATTVANSSGRLKQAVKLQDMVLRFGAQQTKAMTPTQIRKAVRLWLGKPREAPPQ